MIAEKNQQTKMAYINDNMDRKFNEKRSVPHQRAWLELFLLHNSTNTFYDLYYDYWYLTNH